MNHQQKCSASQRAEPLDLGFLDPEHPEAPGRIVRACFSLIICGYSHQEWTGYSFGDNDFAVPIQAERSADEGPLRDPIAGVTGSNVPVWDSLTTRGDPREYFLLALWNRILYVLKKWRNVGQSIQLRIEKHVRLIAKI